MAKLSDELITKIFELLRLLADGIEEASATEWDLFERYGETPETTVELEELQNARDRLNVSYSRLNTLLLRILESQPKADSAIFELLSNAIEQAEASAFASQASIQEVKRIWRLS